MRPIKRARADRGAVLVEYALVLGLLFVVSFATIQVLNDKSDAEVNHQADCISTRPPPVSCQPRTVTTLPPTSVPPTTASTITPPPVVTATAEFTLPNPFIVDHPDGTWDAVVDVLFQTDGLPPTPTPGVTVRVRVLITDPPNPTAFFVDCVTQADGKCQLRFTTPGPGVISLTMSFETTEGFDGVVSTTGSPIIFTHP